MTWNLGRVASSIGFIVGGLVTVNGCNSDTTESSTGDTDSTTGSATSTTDPSTTDTTIDTSVTEDTPTSGMTSTTVDVTTTTSSTTDETTTTTTDETTSTTTDTSGDTTTGTTGDTTTGTTGDTTTGTTGDTTSGTSTTGVSDDPCVNGMNNCDPNAACISEGDQFTCTCEPGFTGDGVVCTDIDECAADPAPCDIHASCSNEPGAFTCTCEPGYSGDGFTCELPTCGDGLAEPPAEACDDGNQLPGDGCRADCKGLEVCGDGLVDYLSEECDDGDDSDPDDGCHACLLPPIEDVAPQKINGDLMCAALGNPNTGRKISSDALGNFYVVMRCDTSLYVARSNDFGATWLAPVAIGIESQYEAAVEGGTGGIAHVVAISTDIKLQFTRTTDAGATWEPVQTLSPAPVEAEVSIDSLNDSVYLAVRSANAGLTVHRNVQNGAANAWTSVDIVQSNSFHDVIVDKISGTVIAASDSPAFHIRSSNDGALTFGAETAPPGQAFFSDWTGSKGLIYAAGTNNDANIDIIPLAAPATSTQVVGLPASIAGPVRSIDADPLGNAYVATQLPNNTIQLDRMVFQSGTIVPADARVYGTGTAPGVAALPNSQGALIVYNVGTDIFAAVEVY